MALRRNWLKYVALGCVITLLVSSVTLYQQPDQISNIIPSRPEWSKGGVLGGLLGSGGEPDADDPIPRPGRPDGHPISALIAAARSSFAELMGKRSLTLEQAAHRYRERRGRHPPPGFDKWFAAAVERDAIVVEEFFDRIHHDVNPFWGVDPLEMRRRARGQKQGIRVRGGQAEVVTDEPEGPEWMQWINHWTEQVRAMLPHLPDLDMPVNVMDESRILVPWEQIDKYVAAERNSRALFPSYEATTEFTSYADIDAHPEEYKPAWIGGQAHKYWDFLRATCPPDSPARNVGALESFNESIAEVFPTTPPSSSYTHGGFVSNATTARDPCQQPHLRGMHGTFVESFSMSTLTDLFPMFGGSKLPQNNELLIPGGMYLTDREMYSGGGERGGPWAKKRDGLVWRGAASGGRNRADNWWHFQRHRFVQMMNGTTVSLLESGKGSADDVAPTFRLLPGSPYGVAARKKGKLGKWLDSFSDAGLVRLDCFPAGESCPYADPYYAQASKKSMREQYDFKFLPDVDGNSFSARWRGFLLSTSCPLKATVYAEWHDDRLVPWLHYVPFDNSFVDIYGIMEYFLLGHDAAAQRIAEEGSEWAAKVLRKEDMMLYMWRLLLEYARVMDPKRDRLAFVADLTGRP